MKQDVFPPVVGWVGKFDAIFSNFLCGRQLKLASSMNGEFTSGSYFPNLPTSPFTDPVLTRIHSPVGTQWKKEHSTTGGPN